MGVRIELKSKVSLDEFKKICGKHFSSDEKLKKAYAEAVAPFEPKEVKKEDKAKEVKKEVAPASVKS